MKPVQEQQCLKLPANTYAASTQCRVGLNVRPTSKMLGGRGETDSAVRCPQCDSNYSNLFSVLVPAGLAIKRMIKYNNKMMFTCPFY